MWYRSDSSQHRPHDNHLDVCSAAIVSRWRQGGVECKLYSTSSSSYSFWAFMWYSVVYLLQINTLLCYTVVSALVLGIGIANGQYYWILDIGCLSWYRSNPNRICTCQLAQLITYKCLLIYAFTVLFWTVLSWDARTTTQMFTEIDFSWSHLTVSSSPAYNATLKWCFCS